MGRIELEVDESAGKLFREFSEQTRKQFGRAISILLKKTVNKGTTKDYTSFLDVIGNKALANGLTPEILEQLLKEDE